jgi:uncharacterized protein YjbJ (UPF0337 family)
MAAAAGGWKKLSPTGRVGGVLQGPGERAFRMSWPEHRSAAADEALRLGHVLRHAGHFRTCRCKSRRETILLAGANFNTGDTSMNWDRIEGQWKQFKGQAQQQWGKLTDDDWELIQGKRQELIGKVQSLYGKRKDDAEREVDAWGEKLR